MSALLWFFLTLGAVLLAMTAVLLYLQGRRREVQDEVLGRLQMGPAAEETEPAEGLLPYQVKNPLLRAVCARFWRAGIELAPGAAATGLGVAALLALLLLWLAGPLPGLLLVVLLLLAAQVILQQLAGRRQRQVLTQLPDYLEHVLRALLAGNSLEESFASAARESAEPTRSLFLGVARQVRLGAPVEDALAQAAAVNDLPDLEVLAMSARVNRRYGGSIRNMLKSLIQVIRGRDTAARKLRALTAETRISALSLFVIPLGITLFIIVQNPAFYDAMWSDTLGRILLVIAAALQLTGGLVIWRMLRSTGAA